MGKGLVKIDMDMQDLEEQLCAYANTDYYPFHMPGHKRVELSQQNPYGIDITEIEGFDNLHAAHGILQQSQERLRKLYNSKKAYYLVNGSTCGILSAAGASAKRGERIIMARNCHKSVYHAVQLFGFQAEFVYPKFLSCGIQGMVDPYDIECLLKKYADTRFVIITSPTYEGIVSNISEISKLVHKYHASLIVDEAHGAHFSLSSYFPESAISGGADIVVQSLHKTLPSFTQTAALHIAGSRVDCAKVEEMLSVFQTSSPSYLLMAGMERCVRLVQQSGAELFGKYEKRLLWFYKECGQLRQLHVFTDKDYERLSFYEVDQSKIVISTLGTAINGRELYEKLLHEYHLQMEMYSAQYVLAMTSIMDTDEGFYRLLAALKKIDKELENQPMLVQKAGIRFFLEKAYAVKKKVLEVSEIIDYNIEETELKGCIGKVCAEYIYLYPPGIPFIIPGEVVTSDFVEQLQEACRMGLNIQGPRDKACRKILTIANPPDDRI